MKKVLLVLALTVISFANAQKGSVLIAGSLEYLSRSNGNYTTFAFSPKIGFQMDNNFTAGISANFESIKDIVNFRTLSYDQYDPLFQSVNSVEQIFNNNSYGAFLRYTKPLAGVFSIYAELEVGIINQEITSNLVGYLPKSTTGFYVGMEPAIFLDLNKGFGLNFSIGGIAYSNVSSDEANSISQDVFVISVGKSLGFGISKNF